MTGPSGAGAALQTPPGAAAALSAPQGSAGRQGLAGLSLAQMTAAMADAGVPRERAAMRARQVWHWMYWRGARDFAAMTTLPQSLRRVLAARLIVERPSIVSEQVSADGTCKWLLRLAGGAEVETVHIPDGGEDTVRGALCVSSQVGCTLNCRFCHTGTQPLVRNLSAGEIVGQALVARDRLGEWPTPTHGRRLSSIVFMGMGEPLYNFDNVSQAVDVMADSAGLAISRRRITLSTAGVVPMMARAGAEMDVQLAISLHAVRDEVRDVLVPLNRRYPIAALLEAARTYPRASNARRITFEYVMLRDVNDSLADAQELVRLLRGIPAKVNLIPFNPWPGAPYACAPPERISEFARTLNHAGLAAPVRTPRGRDIMAACGQLRSASRKVRKVRAGLQAAAQNGCAAAGRPQA